MSWYAFLSTTRRQQHRLAGIMLVMVMALYAAPLVADTDENQALDASVVTPSAAQTQTDDINHTLAAQLQPSQKALSDANQALLSRNAQLQRQVNDLQTQANVLVYESRGQIFLYGALTVFVSLLVGACLSWLVFVRRERW